MRHSLAALIAFAILCAVLFPLGQLQTARADITWTGDVDPSDPTTWTSDTEAYVGKTADGTLTVDDDSDLLSQYGYIGYESGMTGQVTVTGTGSTWDNTKSLYIGYDGNGTLNITEGGGVRYSGGFGSFIGYNFGSMGQVTVDGAGSTWTKRWTLHVGYRGNGTLNITDSGAVTVEDTTWVSEEPGSLGAIHFDNGILTTEDLYCAGDDLTGTGTINTHGLVSDVDLVFDTAHGLNQTFNINNNLGQNITVNLDVDGSGALGAGYSGVGTMSISDGIVVESLFNYIGYHSGSTGDVIINGAGSTWTSRGYYFYVGRYGTGTLTVQNGGVVTAAELLYVNPYDTGSKVVLDNGSITAKSMFTAEADLEGYGTIDAQGWCYDSDRIISQASDLQHQFVLDDLPGQNITVDVDLSTGVGRIGAGYAGTATLTVQNGVSLTSNRGYIGYRAGSDGTVTIEGAGTTWTDTGYYFEVGYRGAGTLNVLNQAILTTTHKSSIGSQIGSTGIVNIDGAGSTWAGSDTFRVGQYGSGTLNITDGGEVTTSDTFVGFYSDSIGVVTVDGSGSTLNSNGLNVGFRGSGTLSITNGGVVSIAGSATFDVASLSESTLAFGIGVDGPGLLDIEGSLTIGDESTLLVTVDSGIDLNINDQFTVVTFDTISSTFTNEPVPTFAGEYFFDWAVNYNANDITLEVITSVLASDFNEDGNVDGVDLLAWRTGFETSMDATHTSGDADGDGDVDGKDFLRWQTQFGSSTIVGSSANTAVPEPATLVLFGIGAMGLFGYRRCNQ